MIATDMPRLIEELEYAVSHGCLDERDKESIDEILSGGTHGRD